MSAFRDLPRLLIFAASLGLMAPLGLVACGDSGDAGDETPLAPKVAEIAPAGEAAPSKPSPPERRSEPRSREEARKVLRSAREALAAQSAAVEAATAQVEAARSGLAKAESRLEVARSSFSKAQRQVEQATGQMAAFSVPDPVLFRNVQSQLLDASSLRDVAIAARVSNGVVTLRGRVPDEKTRAAAVALVEEMDGVLSVDDRLEVAESD